jgi:hypothetical protein
MPVKVTKIDDEELMFTDNARNKLQEFESMVGGCKDSVLEAWVEDFL